MLSKFNLATATAFSGLIGVFTGISVYPNSVEINKELSLEFKDEENSLLNQPLDSVDSIQSVTKALLESHSVNVQEFHIFSVLEHLPVPVTANQHFAFSFFMFNMTVFICLTGLILNHSSKLYGDQYLEKLPK
jgi:hypothetical protein